MTRADRDGWRFGAKVVRGAYMVSERELAARLGIASPVWPDYDATEKNFHEILSTVIASPTAELMVASHNERTMRFVIDQLHAKMHAPHANVYFGQLLGMADNLTFTLALNGLKSYKYIPYGPVDEVIPYLIRRTQENSTLLGTPAVVKERKMIFTEIRRRLLNR